MLDGGCVLLVVITSAVKHCITHRLLLSVDHSDHAGSLAHVMDTWLHIPDSRAACAENKMIPLLGKY